MPVIGVRSSWLMLTRNWFFNLAFSSAALFIPAQHFGGFLGQAQRFGGFFRFEKRFGGLFLQAQCLLGPLAFADVIKARWHSSPERSATPSTCTQSGAFPSCSSATSHASLPGL